MYGKGRGYKIMIMATAIESLELLENQDANLGLLYRVFGHPLAGITLQPYLTHQLNPMM
jgi:hypothetical protein